MLDLRHDSLKLLRECLYQHRPDLIHVIDSNEFVTVDEDLGNELREAVMDEFLRVGLNADSGPNEVGLRLEKLIDNIGRMFM